MKLTKWDVFLDKTAAFLFIVQGLITILVLAVTLGLYFGWIRSTPKDATPKQAQEVEVEEEDEP